jgi:uncharacterized membrane protein YuzA (DUF378 family)
VYPLLLIAGATTLTARFLLEGNSLALLFGSIATLTTFLYPFIGLGVLIWFFFFRQRNLQSQMFAVEINNGNSVGAVVGFISLPRRSRGGVSRIETITTFAPNFQQTIERIRLLLRSSRQQN